MNYWHMQMHPGERKNEFPPDLIKEIIKDKEIIGLGDAWQDKNGDDVHYPETFKSRLSIGDVVAIKQGTSPIALVKIIDDYYTADNIDVAYDWFPIRRRIKILDFYNSEYGFNIPQPRGTLTICNDHNTETSRVIINWHQLVKKRNLMENCKLTPERKKQLTLLWENYRKGVDSHQIKYITKELDSIAADWKKYKTKIEKGTFDIDDFTNRLNSNEDQMPGGYLCNFLERTTKTVLGSSKPAGSALAFGVKLNENGNYSIGMKRPNETKESAIEVFNQDIKPLFENVALCNDAIDKASLFENSKYPSKQILRKLSVLDHLNDFLFMYSDESIDSLHDEIIESDEETNLGKSYEVRQALNEIFEMPNDPVESVIMSEFMWLYANAKGIADKDSPNVILYGPPGTGKTYSVTQSLDFVCQGDRSRYEFIQFHPSFTYEDFIEGIKAKGVQDGNIKFELTDGIFKKFCKKAKNDPENDYYFVVDEINRANLSSVFGETLLCLEKDYRHDVKTTDISGLYKTQYSALIEDMIENGASEDLAYHYENGNAYFGVPKNVFFIGMMNDVDKSIDAFDLALRRRFKWIRKDCDYEVIEQNTRFRNGDKFKNIESYLKCCNALNHYISKELNLGKSYEFGHSFFMKIGSISKLKEISSKNLDELFNLHLRPTLKEYLRALYSESDLDGKVDGALLKFKSPLKKVE